MLFDHVRINSQKIFIVQTQMFVLISSSDYILDALAVYKSEMGSYVCKMGVRYIIDYCGSVFLWYIDLDTSLSVCLYRHKHKHFRQYGMHLLSLI